MPDRRAALVDVGVELILQQRFQDLLSSVDTRSITSAAGVTTGSFFHHFRNRAAFTDAVIERLEQLWAQSTQRSLTAMAGFAGGDDFRDAAAAEWRRLGFDEQNSGLQHLLLAVADHPVSDGAERTAADVLAKRYRDLHDAVLPVYRRGLAGVGREMLPPFTEHDLGVTLTAIGIGLRARHVADPGSVRPELYPDLVSALVIAVTRPAGEQVDVRDVAPLEYQPVSGGRSVLGAKAGTGAWHQIVEAAVPLFVDRRVSDVKVAEIAAVAGVSSSTVYHQFGTVSAVAAAGWVLYLPELEAIATEPLTASEGPVVRMEQVLTRFIELARANRGVLEGLMIETVASIGDGRRRPSAVPALLVPHVRELRTRGLLRRRVDSVGLARSITQLTAMRVLAVLDEPVERVIDDTLGMLLEGALARTER